VARSTRAAAAVARLIQRSNGRRFQMVITGNGLFSLREQLDGGDQSLGEPLPLDDFVRFVNAQGPQEIRRVTKNDAAFAKQLVRKS
jgi:hypothetical protein